MMFINTCQYLQNNVFLCGVTPWQMVQLRNHKIVNPNLMLYFESTGNFRKNEPNLSEIGQAVRPQRLVKVWDFPCALKRIDR